ncbi:hypothetical protein J3R30DRAFT_2566107 [Lentinula aciculospora]|uniref:UDP-Glycosyltransferase/glycogen phosphorylase n=1 Tax=Lentinula aciculospora TaxID=153920 RepID=A0A9W9AE42_9AGAR|nr:hypothetical protein J3R30DRAFT_2566107 [Lentinula aciculospora]
MGPDSPHRIQLMSSVKNILFHALPAWGHNKPMAALAVIILRARPEIVITVITTGIIYPKFNNELKSKLSAEEYDMLSSRINIIDVSGPEINIFEPLKEFGLAYTAIWNSEPVICKSSGRTFSGLPPPTVAVIDVCISPPRVRSFYPMTFTISQPFAAYAYEHIHATPQMKVPIITWLSAPSGPLLRLFGPASLGGDAHPSIETEAGLKQARLRLSEPLSEETKPLPQPVASAVLEKTKVPGMPPMYAHEWKPQTSLLPEGPFEKFGQIYMRVGDGIIIVSNSVYENESMKATKEWFSGIGKPSYALAPLSLPKPKSRQDDEKEISLFLNTMKERFGPKSLIYISFGTFFWPPQLEKLIVLIETLIANQTPFIFSHSSPLATNLSSEFLTLIRDSGIAMEMAWSPQETILQHEVTGWFITHGGWNSIQESFEHKVPLIFWPMGADQPVNAAVLSLTHKAAFELIEVRSGENGTKPLLRFENTDYKPTFTVDAVKAEVEGLLAKIKGDEGRIVRSNFESLGEEMWRSWEEGRQSRTELNEFLEKFVDSV